MRITEKQLEFLDTIVFEDDRVPFWECFRHELRQALSLYKKGLIEFEDGVVPTKDDEFFMARLTSAGWDLYETRK